MKSIERKSRGLEVKILQTYLNINADGAFGPITESAVKQWQTAEHLNVTGKMEQTDWDHLAKSLPLIKYGIKKSNTVKIWQLILGIEADGDFGAKTKAATRTYQASANLEVDGVVGKNTWNHAFGLTTHTPTYQYIAQPVDYKQYDSRWGSVVYTKNNTYNRSQTIKNSGCGPTAMADIVATWWDTSVTPVTMAALSVSNGYRTENSGTAWTFFKFIAQKYQASKFIQTSSIETAKTALDNNAFVVVSFKKSKWTSGGHYCVLWKYENNTFYVNDPASSSSSRAKGSYSEVQAAAKQFFIFYK